MVSVRADSPAGKKVGRGECCYGSSPYREGQDKAPWLTAEARYQNGFAKLLYM